MQTHNEEIEKVFVPFIKAMTNELKANAHKGDRASWLTMNVREANSEVLYHVAKLVFASHKLTNGNETKEHVLEYAADVANCAMMVADICKAIG